VDQAVVFVLDQLSKVDLMVDLDTDEYDWYWIWIFTGWSNCWTNHWTL